VQFCKILLICSKYKYNRSSKTGAEWGSTVTWRIQCTTRVCVLSQDTVGRAKVRVLQIDIRYTTCRHGISFVDQSVLSTRMQDQRHTRTRCIGFGDKSSPECSSDQPTANKRTASYVAGCGRDGRITASLSGVLSARPTSYRLYQHYAGLSDFDHAIAPAQLRIEWPTQKTCMHTIRAFWCAVLHKICNMCAVVKSNKSIKAFNRSSN